MQWLGRNHLSFKIQSLITVTAILLSLSNFLVQAREVPSIEEKIPENKVETIPDSNIITSSQSWREVKLLHTLPEHQTSVDSLLFTPDNQTLISGGGTNDPEMRFWSVATGEQLTQVRAQRTAILAMAMSRDGKILISGGEDAGINFWDWETGKYQTTLLSHQNSVTSLAIAPDNQVLVSGGLDGIKVWNLAYSPQRPIYTLAEIGNPTNVLSISPNGYLLASGNGDGIVKFWNLRTGTLVSEFTAHQQTITGLVFSEDGNSLITASHDRTIKIWDLASGQLLKTLQGHTGMIRAIALHPDEQILASGGNDGIFLWNLQNGEVITQLQEHHNWIQSLAFSPNGKYLASGGFDATVKIWTGVAGINDQ
ncbi:WD-40 repeat-containing protein [Stanieria cyanosphaera PCC 7437]|uniref:WD-40 repeat-containing protein n=1 Tax=Stanieria cyanosphaera (strain ATCC 29371 / PCC 7437) TaxID=111780 RepID=K9XQP1_STAC7|nr:WD40 repeat domain-containing protein [Stanieria cyanosphaera]AFZ34935.1 WD-40 repeat-containing protein [Stanieria cyanosphaera PCC 7437]